MASDRFQYFIVDRKKDMIIRNGFNVYPREIEEVLYAHPAVAEAAVFGVPDAAHGEEIAALVTLKPGAEATEAELQDWVKERIAVYKYPRIAISPTSSAPSTVFHSSSMSFTSTPQIG